MSKLKLLNFQNGLLIEYKGRRIGVDRVRPVRLDYHFISHAHSDHLPKVVCGKLITSKETLRLALERGLSFKEAIREENFLTLINSGHILGSRALLIDDRILVTSDVNIRDRFFIKGFKPTKAEILIIEATYGKKEYVFEETGKLLERILSRVAEVLSSRGRLVAYGYALGKSQLLTKLFSWCKNLIVSEEVARFNRVYEEFIGEIGEYTDLKTALKSGLIKEEEWILISQRKHYLDELVEKYDAYTVEFSGWVKNPAYVLSSGVREGFPLSDHADFKDLIKIVRETDPREIYVAYGFSRSFAKHLNELGYRAVELQPYQRLIIDF